jgi:hypothetical protein
MIVKKKTLSVVGRRNKQQILKDMIRPPASAIVSAPSPGSVDSGGRGGCTPATPGAETSIVGLFEGELISNASGYAPTAHTPSYYTDVYFDGATVFQDDHFTVDEDMNVIPNVGIEPTQVSARYVVR